MTAVYTEYNFSTWQHNVIIYTKHAYAHIRLCLIIGRVRRGARFVGSILEDGALREPALFGGGVLLGEQRACARDVTVVSIGGGVDAMGGAV